MESQTVNAGMEALKKALEQQIKDFLAKAVRRDAGKFTIDTIQYDGREMPNMIKGTIEVKKGNDTKTEGMFWNIHGKAQTADQRYDLVTEAPYNKG